MIGSLELYLCVLFENFFLDNLVHKNPVTRSLFEENNVKMTLLHFCHCFEFFRTAFCLNLVIHSSKLIRNFAF